MTASVVPTQSQLDAAARFFGYASWTDASENGGSHGPIVTQKLADLLAETRIAALEEAARVAEETRDGFLSPEYATGQPLSSFQERFACNQVATAIRSLKEPK